METAPSFHFFFSVPMIIVHFIMNSLYIRATPNLSSTFLNQYDLLIYLTMKDHLTCYPAKHKNILLIYSRECSVKPWS